MARIKQLIFLVATMAALVAPQLAEAARLR
jgi:hypothetical protein